MQNISIVERPVEIRQNRAILLEKLHGIIAVHSSMLHVVHPYASVMEIVLATPESPISTPYPRHPIISAVQLHLCDACKVPTMTV